MFLRSQNVAKRKDKTKMLNFRFLTSAFLACVAVLLVSASLLWGLTPRQDKCASVMAKIYSVCMAGGGYITVEYCAKQAYRAYDKCMGKAKSVPGYSPVPGNYPPLPIIHRPPIPVGNTPSQGNSPPPLTGKPIVHPPVSGPVTNKGPISSPTPTPQTIYAKPNSTPLPRPAPKGHHG